MSNISNKKSFEVADPYFDEVKAKTSLSFDFVLWFYRLLKHWYLFVISLIIFIGLAYLDNKSWVPLYNIQAMLILESRGTNSIVANAVPLGSILGNTDNQRIVLESYGLTERTVKNLPDRMRVDYFIKTYFKYISLYSDTPIEAEIIELKPEAYGYIFNIAYIDTTKCTFSYKRGGDDDAPDNSKVVSLNKVLDGGFFKIKLKKAPGFRPDFYPYSFRFMSNEQLIAMYNNRVKTILKEKESTALTVSISGTNPGRDRDYLNALLDEFQNYNLALKNQQADITISFIDSQLKVINDSLDSSRARLERFQVETGVFDVSSQNIRAELDKADTEREDLAMRERSLLILTERINETILGNTELIEPLSLGIENPKLSSFILTYNSTLKRGRNLGTKNPLYLKTIDELNDLRARILEELQFAQVALQDDKDALVRKYQTLELKIDNLPPQERDFVKFQRNYRVNEMYHQFLTQKQYEAKIQRASNTPDNFVWESPRIMGGAVNGGEPNKTYTFFFLIGLVVPIVIVVIKEEVFNFSIASKEECEKISGLPVIGAIENVAKKLNNGLVLVKNYPKSSFAESFRNMRVRIEYIAQRDNKITVLVTSTEPADGKTFIATNIASVYQLMGKKVVIIDLDLRRPSVGKTLRIEAQKGVSNYLIGQVTLEEITISHPDYGFDIIPAGTLPPNPSELIKTAKTKQLLEHLKEVYDYVIVDCSPVGLVSDAYILSKIADTTLFVVRRGKTNRSFFKSVINQLKFDGVENMALIFNDVKGREGYYGTSRYYGDKSYYLKKNSYYHDDYFEN